MPSSLKLRHTECDYYIPRSCRGHSERLESISARAFRVRPNCTSSWGNFNGLYLVSISVFPLIRMSNEYSLGEVHVSLKPQERFEEYLQSRGKRITQQRRSLVEYIFERHDHFDADELIDSLGRREDGDKISRPTVYRTLNELVEAGLLRKMTLGARAVYEHDYGYPQHDHLFCQICDKLIEFSSDELQTLREAVAREHDFRVTGHRLIITGVCHECSRKQHRRQSPLDLI